MNEIEKTARRHLAIGWLGLLVFLSLGIGLEIMHGLKLQLYLGSKQEMRRMMWTLAHTHGTLFSLINIAFAVTLNKVDAANFLTPVKLASACLAGAVISMPAGFFLGGVWHYRGDPGLGILLVPIGALILLIGVVATLSIVLRAPQAGVPGQGKEPESHSSTARKRKRGHK